MNRNSYRPLADFAQVKGGKRLPKGSNLVKVPNSHPYIRVRDLGLNKILELTADYEYVDDKTQATISRYIVNVGDVIISIVGTIGLVAIIGQSLDNANLTENCAKIVNLHNLDKDYLYYYFSSKEGQSNIKAATVGAVQAKLPLKNISALPIPYIPLIKQRAIAATLSCLDDKIELNNKINANLEAQAQAIFKSWFVDFEPWGGVMPDAWHIEKIGNLCESISCTHSCKHGELIFLNTGDIENGILIHSNYSPVQDMPGQAKKSIQRNDILYSEIRPINRHFAFVTFDADKYIVSTKLMVIRARSIDSRRLYHYLTSADVIRELQIEAESRSGTFPQIRFDNIQQLEILIATPNVECDFTELLHRIYATIDNNNAESACLAALRDTLLPKLMSGEIEVPAAEAILQEKS